MGNPVVHFEINSNNAKSLADFYAQVFGWKTPWGEQMRYALVDTQAKGKGIGGGIGVPSQGGNLVTFYIEVADTDTALRKVEQLGGKTVVPTTTIPNVVTFALFSDPEGNVIGLTKAMPAPRPTTRKKAAVRRRTATRRKTTARAAHARRRTRKTTR